MYFKHILHELGTNESAVSYESIQQRLRDQFVQNSFTEMSSFSRLKSYCMFKTDYHIESYLDTVYCRNYCMTLFNNRCGVLDINI